VITPRAHVRRVSIALAIVVGSSSLPLAAAPSEQQQAIAKDLFDKGVRLMEEGKCDETPTDLPKCRDARDAFKRAYEMTGALGALRNLAYVEKGLGMTASAARDFRELARKAPLDPNPARRKWADFAREEADALEPRVPYLVVKVVDKVPGTKITLDGAPLPEAAWNTAVPVDPGPHSVHAEAPGRLSFEGSATLAEKQEKTISVVLDLDANPTDDSAPSRVPPLVVAGIGVVGIGIGLGLGYASMSKRDSACDDQKLCDPKGLEDGKSLANASSVVTGAGIAVLAVGLVWWALTPSTSGKERDRATAVAPWASANGGGVAAFGRF
jgi:hypothetical protein